MLTVTVWGESICEEWHECHAMGCTCSYSYKSRLTMAEWIRLSDPFQ